MSIQDRQNRPDSLAKLAAQRHMYRRAKCVRGVGMVLILLVATLGLAASVLDNEDLSRFPPSCSSVPLVFRPAISQEEGSLIQD